MLSKHLRRFLNALSVFAVLLYSMGGLFLATSSTNIVYAAAAKCVGNYSAGNFRIDCSAIKTTDPDFAPQNDKCYVWYVDSGQTGTAAYDELGCDQPFFADYANLPYTDLTGSSDPAGCVLDFDAQIVFISTSWSSCVNNEQWIGDSEANTAVKCGGGSITFQKGKYYKIDGSKITTPGADPTEKCAKEIPSATFNQIKQAFDAGDKTKFAESSSNEDLLANDDKEEGDVCYDAEPVKIFGVSTGIPGDPLKWIVCGVSNLLAKAIDGLNAGIESLLIFNPTSDAAGVQLKSVWGRILNVANVLFVIAFLIMVISTALDLGIFSNYTVKKLLPRIIIAAILANLSWGIASTLIGITNIVGGAVREIVLSPVGIQSGSTKLILDSAVDAQGAGIFQTAVVAGLGTLIYFSIASFGAILLPVLATAFIAALVALLALLLRRIIIIVLIILAPLAFAAWALPGGDKWIQRWWKLFTEMLIMYPMIMFLFAAGAFIAKLLTATGGNAGGLGIMTAAMASFAIVLPYFAIPALFKAASGTLANITGMVNDRSKGLVDKSKNWRDKNSQYGRRKELKAQRKNFSGHEKLIHSITHDDKFMTRRRRAQALGRTWMNKGAHEGQRMFLAKTKAHASSERLQAADYDLQAGGIDTRGLTFRVTDTDGKITGQAGKRMLLKKDDALAMAALGATVERMDGKKVAYTLSDGSEDAQRAAAQYAAGQGLVPVITQIQKGGHVWERDAAGNKTNSVKIQNSVLDASGGYQNQHANTVLSEAMQTKVGAMMPKMPSYFKGPGLAFEGIEAGSMSKFHEEEVANLFKHVEGMYNDAAAAARLAASPTATPEQRRAAADKQAAAEQTMSRIGQSVEQIVNDPTMYNMSPTSLAKLQEAWTRGVHVEDPSNPRATIAVTRAANTYGAPLSASATSALNRVTAQGTIN